MEHILMICYKFYIDKFYHVEKMKGDVNHHDRRSGVQKYEQMIDDSTDFYTTKYGEKIHLPEECYGLRKRTSTLEKRKL